MEKDLLIQVVKIPSYLDKKRGISEREYGFFIEKFFRKNFKDFKINKFIVEGKRENLLIIPKNPKVIFCCHLDTVLPSKKNHTQIIFKGDKLFGLGTKDMKGGTVSAISAMLELPKSEQEKAGFLFYCDEERDQQGMEVMLENFSKIPKSTKYFLSPESSFKLGFGCRGYATIKINIFGKRAHTSRPQNGVNSGEVVFRLYESLKNIFSNMKTELGSSSIVLVSMNLGVLVDGKIEAQSNSVPDFAEAIFSIRLSKNISGKNLENVFKNEIKKIHNLKFMIQMEQLRSPGSIMKNKDLEKFLNSAKKFGFDLEFSDPGKSGYNDVAMISSKTGIPFFNFGPYGEGNHGPNEWVSLKSMKDTKVIFKEFIKNL